MGLAWNLRIHGVSISIPDSFQTSFHCIQINLRRRQFLSTFILVVLLLRLKCLQHPSILFLNPVVEIRVRLLRQGDLSASEEVSQLCVNELTDLAESLLLFKIITSDRMWTKLAKVDDSILLTR